MTQGREQKMAPHREVLMIEPEVVRQLRALQRQGWGAKRIARELELARNTVRRYMRGGVDAEVQVRPHRRRLDTAGRTQAVELFDGTAEGNAVVVAELLEGRGYAASVRTVQRAVEQRRRERTAAQVATVRFETAPGHQMQIDFGQKLVPIAGELVRVYLLVAVLSYSRRLYAKAFLSERQDDWREGIAGAFRHFGGVPRVLLGDNARALVTSRDRSTGTVVFHPGYLQFCRDWDVEPRACAPYRARTKGKTEAGVKYVKRNGLAGRPFESFAALEAHLADWQVQADRRVHGTTHERPVDRFEGAEREALRALPQRPLPVRERRLPRRVAHDALVDVDTVRYSVPHQLVRDRVEVLVGEQEVQIFRGAEVVARHRRSFEPHSKVVDPQHFAGLWRTTAGPSPDPESIVAPSALAAMGRSLADYAAVVEGGSP
jgi:transposase